MLFKFFRFIYSLSGWSPFLCVILLGGSFSVLAQDRTVGLMRNDPGAYEGYTLIAPRFHPSVYLINLDGETVHKWEVSAAWGGTNRLLSDGALLRLSASANTWTDTRGRFGRVEIIEWDGTLRWQYDFVTDSSLLHHDVVPLPNGNILGMLWDRRDREALEDVGYNLENLADGSDQVFSERIIEFKPILPDTIEIVWQWDSWNHLVQNHNPLLSNYEEELSEHPDRIDINTATGGSWLHFNALDYNKSLNVIALSASRLNEIWVIDHSTSTEQAQGRLGGNFERGGRLLYRWGNPQNYDAGTVDDQVLHFHHSVLWIQDGLPGQGNLLVFENGVGQPEGEYSTVHELTLPYMEGSYSDEVWYEQDTDGSFKDPESVWTFSSPGEFYSNFLSGQQRLPNGNTLIAEGMTGRIFEVAADSDQIVWEYVNPVIDTGPLLQGSVIPPFGPPGSPRLQNTIFRALRYAVNFGGFLEKDLTPKGPIETSISAPNPDVSFTVSPIYPNPFRDQATISIKVDKPKNIQIVLINILGQQVGTLVDALHSSGTFNYSIDASNLAPGVYFCRIMAGDNATTVNFILQ